jgi:hypothetical protein
VHSISKRDFQTANDADHPPPGRLANVTPVQYAPPNISNT